MRLKTAFALPCVNSQYNLFLMRRETMMNKTIMAIAAAAETMAELARA